MLLGKEQSTSQSLVSTLMHPVVYFLIIFLPFGIVFSLIHKEYDDALQSAVLAEQQWHIKHAHTELSSDLKEAISDVRLLSRRPILQAFFTDRKGINKDQIEKLFSDVLETSPRYDQIRLLDLMGNELIRVDYHNHAAEVAQPESLQNKAQRYYFDDISQLENDQLYMSPLDLNVEQGQIEEPFIPVIRVATPVLDSQGNKQALLIINYHAADFLERLRQTTVDNLGSFMMMTDNAGNFFVHPDPQNEWGDKLGISGRTLQMLYPDIAAQVLLQKPDIIRHDKGAYIVASASPASMLTVAPITSIPDVLPWKIIAFVPEAVWREHSIFSHIEIQLAIALALLFFIRIISLALSNLKIQRGEHSAEQILESVRTQYTEELSDLYENAACGYHSVDKTGIIIRMNNTELRWLGYLKEEVIGIKRYAEFVAEDSKATFDAACDKFFSTGSVQDVHLNICRRDGTTFAVTLNASAIRDEGGNIISSRTAITDITETQRLEDKLKRLARTDPLTGVSNRRDFAEHATRLISNAAVNNQSLAILIFDVDNFKQVNDIYGHHVGDEVLINVTRACVEALRSSDVFARIGGEEFAALLPDMTHQQAIEKAEELRLSISAVTTPLPENNSLTVTVSIGLAINDSEEESLDSLLRKADKNLYIAKNNGRNRVVG